MTPHIIFQNKAFAVINKPSGIAVNADMHGESFWEQLKQYFAPQEIFKVHRLDKGTSGLMVLAFTKPIQQSLLRQFKERTVEKEYRALCLGVPNPPQGLIDLPLRKGRKHAIQVPGPKKLITENSGLWTTSFQGKQGYPSRTAFEVLETRDNISLLKVTPYTGRTHQIRVHMAAIGHPLVGDTLYSNSWLAQKAGRLMLHSYKLSFEQSWISPQERVTFEVATPFLLSAQYLL